MTTTWLMATSLPPGASEEMADAEPVLVEVDHLAVTLTLDSGERLIFDRAQLNAALELGAVAATPPSAGRKVAAGGRIPGGAA